MASNNLMLRLLFKPGPMVTIRLSSGHGSTGPVRKYNTTQQCYSRYRTTGLRVRGVLVHAGNQMRNDANGRIPTTLNHTCSFL